MHTKHSKPSHISDTIKDIFAQIDNKEPNKTTKRELGENWGKVVGEKAAMHSTPTAIKEGVLIVGVDSAAWLYQLHLQEKGLIHKITTLFNKGDIKKIQFRVGQMEIERRKNAKEEHSKK